MMIRSGHTTKSVAVKARPIPYICTRSAREQDYETEEWEDIEEDMPDASSLYSYSEVASVVSENMTTFQLRFNAL